MAGHKIKSCLGIVHRRRTMAQQGLHLTQQHAGAGNILRSAHLAPVIQGGMGGIEHVRVFLRAAGLLLSQSPGAIVGHYGHASVPGIGFLL